MSQINGIGLRKFNKKILIKEYIVIKSFVQME
jgi:hypothetical protein